jgi:hypothetical protein
MKLRFLLALMMLLSGCAGSGDVQEERVTVENGAVKVCGNEPGMSECRDYNGMTYTEELEYTPDESNEAMAKEAEHIRDETPEELETTITNMEHNPQAY